MNGRHKHVLVFDPFSETLNQFTEFVILGINMITRFSGINVLVSSLMLLPYYTCEPSINVPYSFRALHWKMLQGWQSEVM